MELGSKICHPENGSGDFETVKSLKENQFEADGSLSSNAELCMFFSESVELSTGAYSETDASITMDNCSVYSLGFEISDSSLIINYPCFEGCMEKYEKRE